MFIHLHTHSHYSLLDGMPKIPDLVNKAKELKMTSLALTDHGVTYGLIEFYKECKKHDIKPILGVEVYVARRTRHDKEAGVDTKPHHLVLLARDNEGYKNLLRLTSIAHTEGFYYKPRIDKEILKKYSKGLIGLSACLAGEIPRALLSNSEETAERALEEYKEIFGPENFYLELQPQTSTKTKDQEAVNSRIKELAKKTNTPLIATKDVHYINKDDKEAQDALLCIQTGDTLDKENRLTMMDIDVSFSTEDEMRAYFPQNPEAIDNTQKIAEKCDVELKLGENILPTYKTPDGQKDSDYLRQLCEEGLKRRYPEITDEIRNRLDWELETINKMGFASYFLIVQDFVNYARKKGIVVGPGRGSAAGSIVAYSLNVTDLDPIHYKLLFERFLNPDRISMPDIDLDFADIKRHEVIEYVTEKYGQDHVAGIITFGTMMARAVVRDVGRVMGMPYLEVDRIAKMIPPPQQGRHTPLSKHIEESPDLCKIYNENEEIKRLMDFSIKLEGTMRHASQHACAVVIGDNPLTEYTALQKAQGGDVETVTQFSMKPIEDIGLLKMDFLGLANLSIIQDTIEIVKAVSKTEGNPTTIDIEKIPLNDKKTFELLARAETTGVFQLESSGMKRYIKELKPTDLEDIIAMVALYRPGPMQFIESFINRKHGKEKIEYMHPKMEGALKNTYGIPVYQEQVMQISKDLAGFTGGEADTLRKAMGKKIAELMAKMKIKFIEGAVKQGVDRALAGKVFQNLEDFAAYGFNRSHAACYAMIAYRTAYLKANWPNCFMAALMNSDSGNLDRITIEVEECKQIGLEVLPPDINESFPRFSVVPGTKKIRFGLLAIKNVGSDIVEAVIEERKRGDKFDSLEDLLERVQHKNLNKKSLEAFVKCGAMDCFGDRAQMLFNMQKLLDFNRDIRDTKEKESQSLFGADSLSRPVLKMEDAEPIEQKEMLAWEKELLGLYISAHPFSEALPLIGNMITPFSELENKKDGNWVNVAGVITNIHQIRTKKNEPMIFVTIEDLKTSIEVLVFPSVLEKTREMWVEDRTIIVGGRVSFKDSSIKVLVNKVEEVNVENMGIIKEEFSTFRGNSSFQQQQAPRHETAVNNESGIMNHGGEDSNSQFSISNFAYKDNALYIKVPEKMKKSEVVELKTLLQKHPGQTQVFLEVPTGPAIKTSFLIDKEKFV